MVKKMITCPKCGHENLFPLEECNRCGSSFILFPELRALFVKEKQSNGEVKEPISKTDAQQNKPLTCPRCGQENDSLSLECSKCGIVFLKYYEIQARDETDEEKKAELLEKKEEEEKKAEALRKQEEEEERAEALRKQKEDEERAEALRKQKEDEERAEALRKQKEEEERAEALRKQKEEEERAEALRKQKEEEKKAEALRKQEEDEERAEALRKQKEEEERAEALRKQKEEEERAEALRKQKEEEKAEALRKQKEEEERELQKRIEDITNVLKPKPKIKDLLKKYEGQTIGINYDSPTEIKGANLVKVGDDLFSILILDDELMKSYPLKNIMSIIEGVNGVSAGNMEEKSPFSIIIQVYHPAF
jgi:hypothetical protein